VVFDMPDTSVALVLDNDRDGGLHLRPDDDTANEPQHTAPLLWHLFSTAT
jgi:hypothetical protein